MLRRMAPCGVNWPSGAKLISTLELQTRKDLTGADALVWYAALRSDAAAASGRSLDEENDLQYQDLSLLTEGNDHASGKGRGTFMRLRRSLQVAAAALVSPLPAFAQTLMGSVTTDPVGHPAPALGMSLLVALAIALIAVGVYSIRARSAGAVAGFALIAGLSLLAALTYANGGIVIQGTDCNVQTTHAYPNVPGETLTSLCPNRIQIVAITNPCGVIPMAPTVPLPPPPAPPCFVGEILSNGQICQLPICVS